MIRSKYISETFDKKQIQDFIKDMCKPGNLNLFLKSQSLEGKTEHVEEWHKTKYSVCDFTQTLKDKIAKPNVSEDKLKL